MNSLQKDRRVTTGSMNTQGASLMMSMGAAMAEKTRAANKKAIDFGYPQPGFPMEDGNAYKYKLKMNGTLQNVNYVGGNVFIGNSNAARDYDWLKSEGITHIVNATSEIPNFYSDDFHYLTLGLEDDPSEDLINVLEPSYRYMSNVLRYDPHKKILVHCHAGISRSASVVIYYLMRSKNISFGDALNFLREKRPIVNPNEGYTKQLLQIENSKV